MTDPAVRSSTADSNQYRVRLPPHSKVSAELEGMKLAGALTFVSVDEPGRRSSCPPLLVVV